MKVNHIVLSAKLLSYDEHIARENTDIRGKLPDLFVYFPIILETPILLRLLRFIFLKPSPFREGGLGEGFEFSVGEANKGNTVAMNKFKE